ncbi:MAG: hypothetical protein H6747_12730 [Deltaproteobacteria bacterium]|nr:hypothetical protein [Deltaproteobacteria bacterium]
MPTHFRLPRGLAGLTVALATLLSTIPAVAAPPPSLETEGVLTAAGGIPAVDGSYELSFALYAGENAKSPVWQEGPTKVTVAAGRFRATLGLSKPLPAQTLASMPEAWLGVSVGTEPELPRQRLAAAAYAVVASALACDGCVQGDQLANGGIAAAKIAFNYAGSAQKGGAALDLACSGCVSAAEMKFDADIDLGGNSVKAKNGTFTGDVAAKSVIATSFVGDGSKLTGLPFPNGTCPQGQVVRGIAPDGKLLCAAGGLPADGLDEVSNGLLTNQFVDTKTADKKNVAIPDSTGSDAISDLTFPDVGLAQALTVQLQISNSDLSNLEVTLLPPNDKKIGYVLCSPCGKDDTVKTLNLKLPPTAPKSGDLSDWVGQNPKGVWTLKVKDTSFCVVQKPGNDKICDLPSKVDGAIVDWSIAVQTLSSKKIAATGDVGIAGALSVGGTAAITGDLQVSGQIVSSAGPLASNFKYVFINNDWRNKVADGKWKDIPKRTLTYAKKRADSVLRITYQDTLGTFGSSYDRCRWRILVDSTQVAYFSAADLQYGTAWRMQNSTHTGLGVGFKAGSHTIKVQNAMNSGGSECLMGWNTSQNFLAVEEVGP